MLKKLQPIKNQQYFFHKSETKQDISAKSMSC